MNDINRRSSLRRRISCRLSIFRRASKHGDDEKPKSRKLLDGPVYEAKYQDVLEAAQEKTRVQDTNPKTIGDLADDLDSSAIRKVMQTAERRRDVERRRSITQLGFRLAYLTGRQSVRNSMAESEFEHLLSDSPVSEIKEVQSPSRSVSLVYKDSQSTSRMDSPFPQGQTSSSSRPVSIMYPDSRSGSRQDSSSKRPESQISSRPSSTIVSPKGLDIQKRPRPASMNLGYPRNTESRNSSRPNSMIFSPKSPDTQKSPRPASINFGNPRNTGSRNSSRPASAMLLRSSDPPAEPAIEVGIRVGEFDENLRKPYIYSPLHSDRVIRLLSLRKPSVDMYKGGYYYQVMIMSLDDPVPFEAVSYVWGNFDRNCRLNFMDGSYLPITESLASSLVEISGHCKTGYLFIDQICVDQANVVERNYQAKIAGDITRRASRLLVSLQMPPPTLRAVVPLLDLALLYESNQRSVVDLQWALAPFLQLDRRDSSLNSINWRSVVDLLSHAWFMRSWVFQEVVLSKTVSFMFDQKLIPFDALVHLALATSRLETAVDVMPAECVTTQPGFHRLYSMVQQRSDRILYGRVPNFWNLLSETAPYSRSADSRDSLYSLLGFLDESRVKIQPNYRTAKQDIFIDAARCSIEGKLTLDILSYIPRLGRLESREEGIPSWVPDWQQPAGDITPLTSPERNSPFKACLDRPHHVPIQPRTFRPIRLLMHKLKVYGRIIDTVIDAKIEPFWDSGPWMSRDLHDFLRLENVLSYLQHSAYTAPGEMWYTRERILKVLLADGTLLYDTPEFSRGVYLSDPELAELAQGYRHFDSPDPFDSTRFRLASWARNVHTLRSLSRIALGRRLFIGEDGRLGLAHHSVEMGDVIAILHGSRTPVVLRPRSDGRYETKGQCYLEDAMYGEAVLWDEPYSDEFIIV